MTFSFEICFPTRKLIICFESIFVHFEIEPVPRKLFICFEIMICSFENTNDSKEINYLIRKYDLFIQEYVETTPKWNGLIVL